MSQRRMLPWLLPASGLLLILQPGSTCSNGGDLANQTTRISRGSENNAGVVLNFMTNISSQTNNQSDGISFKASARQGLLGGTQLQLFNPIVVAAVVPAILGINY